MIKVDKSHLQVKDGKNYHNNIEFTGISYILLVHPFISNKKIGCLEEEIINGVATGFCAQFYTKQRICKRYTKKTSSIDFTWKFETYYIDGQICERGEFESNELHGEYECFYEDGSPFIKANFYNDSRRGTGSSFYRNGVICEEGDILSEVFTNKLVSRLYSHQTPTLIEATLSTYGVPYADHFLTKLIYARSDYAFRLNSNHNVLKNYKSFSMDEKIIVHIEDFCKETFDENENRLIVGSYNEHGQKHGQVTKFSYGQVDQIESYLNDTLNGLFLKFNYKGFIRSKGDYHNGAKSGTWTTFYDNGLLESLEVHLNSSQYLFTSYYENQQIESEAKVIDGLYEGTLRNFHENGSLQSEKIYKNGRIIDGEIKCFYDNGNTESIFKYENGESEGLCFTYYNNGNLKTKCYFSKGEKAGLFEQYYETGILKIRGKFRIGVYDFNDEFVFFSEDGDVIEKPEDLYYNDLTFN
jgi:antitoxin component YwqK of YwqJK toxin-antitoxin module